ncbi:MAG: hypothetical protein CMM74_07665 [Rhodospirillaceae bacterium]|nr:hypothetical protein [Rhodospirillaceae bacterium]
MKRKSDAIRRYESDYVRTQYFLAKDSIEPVLPDQLLNRSSKGLLTVLDVRQADEFKAGHLPGAVNIPLKELERRITELPKDQDVVAYCRGPYCVLSFDAVDMLRHKGYQAKRLENGLPEWKLAGYPVALGAA